MRVKTLLKWLIVLAIVIGISLGGWLSLDFILTLDKVNEYPIISRFWYGVREGCVFITITLAFVWVFVLIFAIIKAIVGEKEDADDLATDRYDSFELPKPQKPKQPKKPKRRKDNWVIDLTNISHTSDDSSEDEW